MPRRSITPGALGHRLAAGDADAVRQVVSALLVARGDAVAAARTLDVSERTLRRWIARYPALRAAARTLAQCRVLASWGTEGAWPDPAAGRRRAST